MNCHDCQDLLQRHLDGEPSTAPDLDRHLAECPGCRGLFAAAQQLRQGLLRLVPPVPPDLLAKRTVTQVIRQHRGRRRLRWSLAAAMMAACILFAVWFFRIRPSDTVPGPVAIGPAPTPQQPREPTLRESVQEARTALDGLADRIFSNTRQQADVMRDATAPLEMARFDESQPRPSNDSKSPRARPGMTTGLQTVAATTRRGLTFLLRETPPLQNGKKNAE